MRTASISIILPAGMVCGPLIVRVTGSLSIACAGKVIDDNVIIAAISCVEIFIADPLRVI